jgi:hypothetical protein
MSERYPFGPLTRENFEKLANSFYDASQTERQRIAVQRGIKSGEILTLLFGDMKEKAEKSRETNPKALQDEGPGI